ESDFDQPQCFPADPVSETETVEDGAAAAALCGGQCPDEIAAVDSVVSIQPGIIARGRQYGGHALSDPHAPHSDGRCDLAMSLQRGLEGAQGDSETLPAGQH